MKSLKTKLVIGRKVEFYIAMKLNNMLLDMIVCMTQLLYIP